MSCFELSKLVVKGIGFDRTAFMDLIPRIGLHRIAGDDPDQTLPANLDKTYLQPRCLHRFGGARNVGLAKSAWTARHHCLQKDAKTLNAFTCIIAASARLAGFVWTFFSGYSDPSRLNRRRLNLLPPA
jgi:hypothetical protein